MIQIRNDDHLPPASQAMSPVEVRICSSLEVPRKHCAKRTRDEKQSNPSADFSRLVPRPNDIDCAGEGTALEESGEESHRIYGLHVSGPGKTKR